MPALSHDDAAEFRVLTNLELALVEYLDMVARLNRLDRLAAFGVILAGDLESVRQRRKEIASDERQGDSRTNS